jgi:hypothetical protein
MNWKRGLFRLWVIVSLLWLALAGFLSIVVVTDSFTVTEDRLQTAAEIAADIAECDKKDPENETVHCTVLRLGGVTSAFPIGKAPRVWRIPPDLPWYFWPTWFGYVFAPPMLLFAVGAAGYWAARGFRRSN